MRRTKILNAEEVRRTTYLEAQKAFHKHCRLKNLRPRTNSLLFLILKLYV